uniref:U4/U6.U5 tri-snRNP-associated protein 1 n=1 Tax=Caenorhabditis tropicalis TaxID=1561998 RepID=A0A1I7TYF9_9PELO
MSSKYAKKRKQLDEDTSEAGRSRRDSSRTPSPPRSKKQAKQREEEDNGEPAESMSIEETNKLRASLGLAPLETTETKERDANDGTNEKIYNEDGFEFRHRKADNLADKKKEKEIKEKLEVAKTKRDVYSKVLKAKKLADSDEEDSAASFVQKLRQKEDEAKKAAERAAAFDQLDEELGVTATINKAFIEGDQILVLQDKGILDDGDEVLVNPNLLDDERHVRNVELRKRKDPNRNFDEDVDEFGNLKNFGVLAKYDETLEGEQKKQFRLDEHGGVDIEEEKREMEAFRRMKMAGKRLESLESKKYELASEFYTQDEMTQFRKVKKGKKDKNIRKRKVLKASDLVPVEKAGESRDFGRRRRDSEEEMDTKEKEDVKEEEGEIQEAPADGKWKKAMQGNGVDLQRLQKLRAKHQEEEDSDEDELMFTGGVDLTGVVIDDDAEEELSSILAKTRKVKQIDGKKMEEDVGKRVQDMLSTHGVKMEIDDEEEDVKPAKEGQIYIDSTSEYCRHVGEINTLGLGGNRDASEVKKQVKEEEEEETEGFEQWKRAKVDKDLKEKERRKLQDQGGWLAAGKPMASNARLDSDDEDALEEAKKRKWSEDEDEEDDEEADKDEYAPALGREVDVSKGVGQMLKLAGQKGYLHNPNAKSHSGPSLDHLKNKASHRVDGSRFDPDDRNAKKADRINAQNRGPVMPFAEKTDYKPDVNISYVDRKGRDMDAKDAYRELSYKFHGRNPGKKQLEKRANRKDKEERMLKTNSYDTPLGTLSKQLKKQKQLSTPYLVLSGSSDHSSLKKE